ncbi:MAG: hypothetical protein Ct9H300mP1_18660 [Planctomycetaceae bacterium]|nr:MAG: hypothetical protein Ct9H300mP1_18660 [Planctomycetaceae bacterium]
MTRLAAGVDVHDEVLLGVAEQLRDRWRDAESSLVDEPVVSSEVSGDSSQQGWSSNDVALLQAVEGILAQFEDLVEVEPVIIRSVYDLLGPLPFHQALSGSAGEVRRAILGRLDPTGPDGIGPPNRSAGPCPVVGHPAITAVKFLNTPAGCWPSPIPSGRPRGPDRWPTLRMAVPGFSRPTNCLMLSRRQGPVGRIFQFQDLRDKHDRLLSDARNEAEAVLEAARAEAELVRQAGIRNGSTGWARTGCRRSRVRDRATSEPGGRGTVR